MAVPKFTLRTLMIAVAVVAAGTGALFHPTPRVAGALIVATPAVILVAACIAVGTRQPARSFWLGFVVACSGFLGLDVSRRHFLGPDVFTRKLVSMVEGWLPDIVHRGPPGTTRYFQSGGQFPVYYVRFGNDGRPETRGQMTLEQALSEDAIEDERSLRRLPHIDNFPTSYMRSKMLPYLLALMAGLAGGLLSCLVRRRTMRSTQAVNTPR